MDDDARHGSLLQFSLRQLFGWMTAVALVCALALGWVNHLRTLEARDGTIPVGTANLTVFLAIAFVMTLLGLLLGPLLCFVVALCKPHRRQPYPGNSSQPNRIGT